MTMTVQAQVVIRAAKNRKGWGDLPARRFVEKCGIAPRLYRVARQCEATIGQPFERRDALHRSLNSFI